MSLMQCLVTNIQLNPLLNLKGFIIVSCKIFSCFKFFFCFVFVLNLNSCKFKLLKQTNIGVFHHELRQCPLL